MSARRRSSLLIAILSKPTSTPSGSRRLARNCRRTSRTSSISVRHHCVLNEARVVRRQVTGADVLVLDPEASVLETLAGEVVERPLIAILDRVTPEPDEAPLTLLPVQPYGVVCLPDVRTVANGDEALQVERHLLPAHASLQRAAPQRFGVRDESEAEIQLVLVDRREDRFRGRAHVLELDEHLPLSSRPHVD